MSDSEHRSYVQTGGWGEPLTMVPVCTCGWSGQAIQQPYLLPEQLPDPPAGPAIRARCAELGEADPDQFGTYEEAVVLCLLHRDYEPDGDLAQALAEFDAALDEVVQAAARFRASTEIPGRNRDYEFTARLDRATAALARARYERHVWLTVPPPPVRPRRRASPATD